MGIEDSVMLSLHLQLLCPRGIRKRGFYEADAIQWPYIQIHRKALWYFQIDAEKCHMISSGTQILYKSFE